MSTSLEYARSECRAAPATIELFVEGLYVVIHQERGWPRQIVRSEDNAPQPGRDLDFKVSLPPQTNPQLPEAPDSLRPFAGGFFRACAKVLRFASGNPPSRTAVI
jgi:hypothetical protein